MDKSDEGAAGAIGTPRWVKVSALVAAVLIAVVVLMMVVGGGDHGPGRHTGGNHRRAVVIELGE